MTEVHRWEKPERRGEGCWWLTVSISFWPSLKPKQAPFLLPCTRAVKGPLLCFLLVEKQVFYFQAVALIHFSIQILPAFTQPQNIAAKTSDHLLQPSGFSLVKPDTEFSSFPLWLRLLICLCNPVHHSSLTFSPSFLPQRPPLPIWKPPDKTSSLQNFPRISPSSSLRLILLKYKSSQVPP